MFLSPFRRHRRTLTPFAPPHLRRLRSVAVSDTIEKAAENRTPVVALYNYPSFSGAFSGLFAHLYHSRLDLPCLILPFSSVVPFRVDDLCFDGLKTCYFLDFIGPRGFAIELSRRTGCEVICFDHRRSTLSEVSSTEGYSEKVTFHIDIAKSSSRVVYEYFSSKLKYIKSTHENGVACSLLDSKHQHHIEQLLTYIEDGDLRQWRFPNIREFNIGISEWRSELNCITNPHMYGQAHFHPDELLDLSVEELIARGNTYISSRKDAVKGFLEKAFILKLGQGLYGECLGVRADSNPDLSDEIGKELSLRSAAAGLRPIGAVVFMQRNNLKMCLRSVDTSMDTSEVAKAYGGGGSPSSSSFIIRMDEFNQWLSVNS